MSAKHGLRVLEGPGPFALTVSVQATSGVRGHSALCTCAMKEVRRRGKASARIKGLRAPGGTFTCAQGAACIGVGDDKNAYIWR